MPDVLRNAFLGGGAIALLNGLVGWFVVLRGQVFAGDAMGHVAFTGALAAAALALDVRLGLVVGAVLVAAVLGLLGQRARADEVVIGAVFAAVLGAGVYLLARLASTGGAGGADDRRAAEAAAAARSLFGSVLSLRDGDVVLAVVVSAVLVAAVLLAARRLLLVTLDPGAAQVAGISPRAADLGFLLLVGFTAAAASQAVGPLLALGLLVAPAAAAHRLTPRPGLGLLLAALIAVGATWTGLGVSTAVAWVPANAGIVLAAVAVYAVAGRTRRRAQVRPAARAAHH